MLYGCRGEKGAYGAVTLRIRTVRMAETSPHEACILVLPVPPSINHQYATVHGRRILSRAGREFKALVANAVAQWREAHAAGAAEMFQQQYLTLSMTFYVVSALRRDLDSGLKIAQDALCEALGVNDNLVVEIHLFKRVDRHFPRIELCLAVLASDRVPPDLIQRPPPVAPVSTDPWAGLRKRPGTKRRRPSHSLEELAARHGWSASEPTEDTA